MSETRYRTAPIRVPVPVHAKLLELQAQEQARKQRPVPLGDLVEMAVDYWIEHHGGCPACGHGATVLSCRAAGRHDFPSDDWRNQPRSTVEACRRCGTLRVVSRHGGVTYREAERDEP